MQQNCNEYNMNTQPAQAKEVLIQHGISPSRPRMAILKYLQEHHTHPTADEIYNALRSTIPTLSPATVYNTLKLFTEKNLCLSLTINEKRVCFDGLTHLHGHFFCSHCGNIYDVPQEMITVKAGDTLACGHQVCEAHYYYKGVCAHCVSSCSTANVNNNIKNNYQ